MTDPALEDYIESEIIPRYAHFDKAHDIAHVRSVIERSLALARARGADERTAYVVAAYHDTGLIAGRERHHLVSGEILAAAPVLRRFVRYVMPAIFASTMFRAGRAALRTPFEMIVAPLALPHSIP